MRVVPDREMPAVPAISPLSIEVAVAEQDRRLVPVRFDARGVDREHVGPVEEIGDAPEALRLALRAIDAARAVEAHQLGVGGRVELGVDRQHEGRARRVEQGEPARRRRVGVGGRAARRRGRPRQAAARRRRGQRRALRRRPGWGAGRASRRSASRAVRGGCRDRRGRSGSRSAGIPRVGSAAASRCACGSLSGCGSGLFWSLVAPGATRLTALTRCGGRASAATGRRSVRD